MEGEPSPAVAALREQFGYPNQKLPDISRRVTACVACRRQKIKCFMDNGQPPCTRCRKRKLPCSINKSLQMILEDDAGWKDRIELKVRSLEATMSKVAKHVSLPSDMNEAVDVDDDKLSPETSAEPSTTSPQRRTEYHTPHNFEIVMDPDSGPAAIPGSVVTPISNVGPDKQKLEHDLIARRVITVEQAQAFLDIYQDRLDHFLYRILGDRRSLDEVRTASPLLTAAICAVAALHAASPEFEACYQEFVSIAATQTFSRRSNVDDVRGLCIAAFWLSGISWTCIGAAVRVAIDLQLHRSIFKALRGDRAHYARTRLFYLVYVCDHQSSIPYGRPPMTGRCDAVQASLSFLETEHAVQDDARLVCQVQLWSICTDIYESFGIDVERPLDAGRIEQLRHFSIKIDKIRADWTERFYRNQYVGNYPKKGMGLHYHFAKLYLCSMAFRGMGRPGFKSPDIALDIDETADAALLSATAIIRTVITDPEIQDFLNGLPTYFDVMIAFAAVFLLKVSTTYVTTVRVDTNEIRMLIKNLVTVLKKITANMHTRHLLVSVAHGVEALVKRCIEQQAQSFGPSPTYAAQSQSRADENIFGMDGDWTTMSMGSFSMGEFDFLPTQVTMEDVSLDPRY